MPRHRRGIAYELSQQRITAAQAEHYATRPVRWYARTLATWTARGAARCLALARRGLRWLAGLDLKRLAAAAWLFCVSQRFRAHLARRFVGSRLRAWRARRFLDRAEVRRLGAQLRRSDESSYLTDFAVHLMIKPPIKFLQWFVVPLALAVGAIDAVPAAILLVAGGMIGRTLYTTGRLVQAAGRGQRLPWIAWASACCRPWATPPIPLSSSTAARPRPATWRASSSTIRWRRSAARCRSGAAPTR